MASMQSNASSPGECQKQRCINNSILSITTIQNWVSETLFRTEKRANGFVSQEGKGHVRLKDDCPPSQRTIGHPRLCWCCASPDEGIQQALLGLGGTETRWSCSVTMQLHFKELRCCLHCCQIRFMIDTFKTET